MSRVCSVHGERRNSYRVLVGKPGRPRCRWEGTIKMDHSELGWSGVNCIHLAQDKDHWLAVMNAVLNLWIP
jgi:hypothetical protein